MKLSLTLEAATQGVRASLVEEWEETAGAVRMAPMVRVFDNDDLAMSWARGWARRRGLRQLFLSDGRKSGPG